MRISLITIMTLLSSLMLLTPIVKASEPSGWSTTAEIGTTGYDFRGASDNTSLFGFKIERHWNEVFSIHGSIHTTEDFHLLDVPRFEINHIEIPGVKVNGNYTDISIGITGRFDVQSFFVTATVGYTNQRISANATIVDIDAISIFTVSDGDQAFYYGLGLEIPLSDRWLINLDFKNNSLLTNSEIFSSTIGLEYRF